MIELLRVVFVAIGFGLAVTNTVMYVEEGLAINLVVAILCVAVALILAVDR